MRASILLALAAQIGWAGAGLAHADTIKVDGETIPAFQELENELETTFESVAELPNVDVEPQLINGTIVDRKYFPAVIRMTTGGTCTASIVGPASILLAAHCVRNLARISFISGGQKISAICEHAPGYISVDSSQDWAMCLLEKKVSGIPYETIDVNKIPGEGDSLVLTGYGCTKRDGGLDGLLRIGFSNVVGKPSRWQTEPSTIYTGSDLSKGEAVLCPGDSGGPIYRFTGGLRDSRRIVGVNSRTTFELGISLFAATASPAGSAFIKNWAARRNQSVCGINLAEGCK